MTKEKISSVESWLFGSCFPSPRPPFDNGKRPKTTRNNRSSAARVGLAKRANRTLFGAPASLPGELRVEIRNDSLFVGDGVVEQRESGHRIDAGHRASHADRIVVDSLLENFEFLLGRCKNKTRIKRSHEDGGGGADGGRVGRGRETQGKYCYDVAYTCAVCTRIRGEYR